uniref:Uncharacterized LOC100145817 n=1 Tax=Xenopus tropicalis TaxID=8364 RepID=A0A803JJ60_XENTR
MGNDLQRMKTSSKMKCRISALCCFVHELYTVEKYLGTLNEKAGKQANNTITNALELLKLLDASYSKTEPSQYLEKQCEQCKQHKAHTTTKNLEGFIEDFEALLKNLATNL